MAVPTGRGRSRKGITVHQYGPIHASDVRRIGSIPVTSADLVLIHLSPHLDETELEQMLVAAESLKLLNRRRLTELLEPRAGRPGTANLRSLLVLEPAIVKSDSELLMIPIYRLAGVTRPLFNHPIRVPGRIKPLVVDLAWPDLRLVVEFDSQRWHGDWERAEADRERDHLLALASHLCHRFVRRQVREEPDEAAHLLSRLVALRATEVR